MQHPATRNGAYSYCFRRHFSAVRRDAPERKRANQLCEGYNALSILQQRLMTINGGKKFVSLFSQKQNVKTFICKTLNWGFGTG
jgi:hypothetical protein